MTIILTAGQTKKLDVSLTAVIVGYHIIHLNSGSNEIVYDGALLDVTKTNIAGLLGIYYYTGAEWLTYILGWSPEENTLKSLEYGKTYTIQTSVGQDWQVPNYTEQPPPAELVIRNLYVTPTVVAIGNPVSIIAQLVCVDFEGTIPVTCVVDGTTLTGIATFSALKVWDDVTFIYTPQVAKTYTATVLGASVTFEAKEVITAHYECPWCEGPYKITYYTLINELTSEELLAQHIAAHCNYWEADTYYIECPYCDWRFLGDTLSISWSIVEHIKANHITSCPLCGVDLTFIGSAIKFSEKYQAHMATHGETVPSLEIKELFERSTEPIGQRSSYYQQPFIQQYMPTICITGLSSPLGGRAAGGTTIERSTCRGSYLYSDTWEAMPERVKLVIPALSGKSWQAKLLWYDEGNQMANEVPTIHETTIKSGSGQVVKLDNFLVGYDADRDSYANEPKGGRSMSVLISWDNERLLINLAYLWNSAVNQQIRLAAAEYSYDGSIKGIIDARDILIGWVSGGYQPYGDAVICSRGELGITTSRPSVSEIEAAYQSQYNAYTGIYNTKMSAIETLLAEYNNNWLDC